MNESFLVSNVQTKEGILYREDLSVKNETGHNYHIHSISGTGIP